MKVKSRPVFSEHDPIGIKLLTRLRLGFSHLNEHKFRHNFGDTVSAMCDGGSEKKPFGSLHHIKPSILKLQKDLLLNILLFVSSKFEETINT